MKAETFRKVVIKSEADLPKEDEEYIVHFPTFESVVCLNKEAFTQHKHRIDWYLQPISASESLESKRELLIKLIQTARKGSMLISSITDNIYWKFDIDSEISALESEPSKTEPAVAYNIGTQWKEAITPAQRTEEIKTAEETRLLNEIINNQLKLMVNAEEHGYNKAMEEFASLPQNEINDIIDCICKFDASESLEVKGKYFETIQQDLKRVASNFHPMNREKFLSDFTDYLSDELGIAVHSKVIEAFLSQRGKSNQ